MKICILMENTTASPELQAEHGLSIYMETSGHKLLVDTGQSSHLFPKSFPISLRSQFSGKISFDRASIGENRYASRG